MGGVLENPVHRYSGYQQVVNTKYYFRLAGQILHDSMPSKTFDLSLLQVIKSKLYNSEN
jgi:hypothetical protein